MEGAAGAIVLAEDMTATVVSIHRPWSIGDFTRRELDNFAALIPHVQRAVQLQRRLAGLKVGAAASAGAFDRLRDGVVMVDNGFAILFANRAAEEILAKGHGLCRAADGIAAETPGGTAALRRLIAGGKGTNGLPGAGGRCALARRAGRTPLSVLVMPIRSEVTWIALRRPAAILFVSDPDRDGRVRADGLRRRFGLTPAETAFVVEIVKGDGLEAAAGRLGVSLATARTHLRHVFDKTGTRRQAELVGLAVIGQAALRENL